MYIKNNIKSYFRKEEDLSLFVEKYAKERKCWKHYIWGCNVIAKDIEGALLSCGVDVEAFIESDVSKTGGIFCKKKVVSINEITFDNNCVIWISHNYYKESEEAINSKVDNCCIELYNCRCNTLGWFDKHKLEEEFYSLIHENEKVFLYPKFSIGDAYILGCFFNDYINTNDIGKYIILTKSIKTKCIFEMFDLNVQHIREYEFEYFITKYDNIINLCPDGKMTNLIDFYLSETFGNRQLKSQMPQKICDRNYASLQKGSTIILSPYSNSIKNVLGDSFWIELAEKLKSKGYSVVTNCSTAEEVIKGTEKVSIDLNEFLSFAVYCGYFIGYRSGLCDLICQLDIKSIIMYPDEELKSLCSVEKIKNALCKEIVLIDEEITINEILRYMQ